MGRGRAWLVEHPNQSKHNPGLWPAESASMCNLQRKFGKLRQSLLQNSYFLVGWILISWSSIYERVLKWDPPSVISPPSPSASCSRRRDCRSGARDAARPRKGEGLETATMTRTNLTENGTSSANPRPVLESLRKMLSDELCWSKFHQYLAERGPILCWDLVTSESYPHKNSKMSSNIA